MAAAASGSTAKDSKSIVFTKPEAIAIPAGVWSTAEVYAKVFKASVADVAVSELSSCSHTDHNVSVCVIWTGTYHAINGSHVMQIGHMDAINTSNAEVLQLQKEGALTGKCCKPAVVSRTLDPRVLGAHAFVKFIDAIGVAGQKVLVRSFGGKADVRSLDVRNSVVVCPQPSSAPYMAKYMKRVGLDAFTDTARCVSGIVAL